MNIEKGSGRETGKDRKTILREERLKKEKTIEVQKTEVDNGAEKKEKLLREVTVKIGLKQEDKEEEIVVEALLDSNATGLVDKLRVCKKKQV